MRTKSVSFRIGKVRGFLRGKVWSLCYHELGRRRRPRVGPDPQAARHLAAQINAQLLVGAPAALSFEPVAIPVLRDRWLAHHEQVLRSSVQTRMHVQFAGTIRRCVGQKPIRKSIETTSSSMSAVVKSACNARHD